MDFANQVLQPKDQEVFWHFWKMPVHMSRYEAIAFFKKNIAPRDYTFEKFIYNPQTGHVRTV